jgi:hypothetical protein
MEKYLSPWCKAVHPPLIVAGLQFEDEQKTAEEI